MADLAGKDEDEDEDGGVILAPVERVCSCHLGMTGCVGEERLC